MLKYLKYYFQPSVKEVREKAYSAAVEHYREKPFTKYDLRTKEFQAYQMGFIRAYRRAYALSRLADSQNK